jgi:hypothetical protein
MNKKASYVSIYEQRYETYRHLDKLRWYVFQVGFSVIGAIISLRVIDNPSLFGIGVILVSTGMIMLKINHGIDKNNIALKKIANKLGDVDIPDIHNRSKFKSTSWVTGYLLTISGYLIIFYEISHWVYNSISNLLCL